MFPTNETVKGNKESNNLYKMIVGSNNMYRQAHTKQGNWVIKSAHGAFVFMRKNPEGMVYVNDLVSIPKSCIIDIVCHTTVARGSLHHDVESYQIIHSLTLSSPETPGTYWLGPDWDKNAFLVVNLGCGMEINTVHLVNTKHAHHQQQRGTGEFKILVSEADVDNSDEEYREVMADHLSNNNPQVDPLPLQIFSFPPVITRYVKFQVVSYYGAGSGLQYFKALKSGIKP